VAVIARVGESARARGAAAIRVPSLLCHHRSRCADSQLVLLGAGVTHGGGRFHNVWRSPLPDAPPLPYREPRPPEEASRGANAACACHVPYKPLQPTFLLGEGR
jgi:hypothetical protein